MVFEHPSLGRVAFVRQPIQSVIIQCSVGSLAKRTLPERRSSILGRADDRRPGDELVFEHPSLGRVAFVRQPIQSAKIQCSVGSLAKRTLPRRRSSNLGRAGSMTRPQMSAENHKPSTAAAYVEAALPKHWGPSPKNRNPSDEQSLSSGGFLY